jgi:hypothetical protein
MGPGFGLTFTGWHEIRVEIEGEMVLVAPRKSGNFEYFQTTEFEVPDLGPTFSPTISPGPSAAPSIAPSYIPSSIPSAIPSDVPSNAPSVFPSDVPTSRPSDIPSSIPTVSPSTYPTISPTVTFEPTIYTPPTTPAPSPRLDTKGGASVTVPTEALATERSYARIRDGWVLLTAAASIAVVVVIL